MVDAEATKRRCLVRSAPSVDEVRQATERMRVGERELERAARLLPE